MKGNVAPRHPVNFSQGNGLVPAIIQDARSGRVLMLGYMNRAAYQKTLESGRVTFYSRSRQVLWTKGETSGNYLHLVEIRPDCDGDTLLVKAIPAGPVCHTGRDTCFGEENRPGERFLEQLEQIIASRRTASPERSYTARLMAGGVGEVGRKLSEEATEVLLAALVESPERLVEEAADLLYHLLVLLQVKGVSLRQVEEVLRARHQPGDG